VSAVLYGQHLALISGMVIPTPAITTSVTSAPAAKTHKLQRVTVYDIEDLSDSAYAKIDSLNPSEPKLVILGSVTQLDKWPHAL